MSTVLVSRVQLSRTRPPGIRVARLQAVAAAMAAALAVWVIAELVFGIDLPAPAFDGSLTTLPIRAQDVIMVCAMLSFAAWGSIAVLERLTVRAPQIWVVIAIAALGLSLATPLAGTGVTMLNRIVLMLMHAAHGDVLIPALYRSSPRRDEPPLG